ncbi:MAG: 23S rRNA (pseudouridine(1915)-N(3))-methyltransferase RlmH [Pseudomonadota bacterium]
MHLRVLAVGRRQPGWVDEACRQYRTRLPRAWRFELIELDAGRGRDADVTRQGERLLRKVGPAETLVALDERGAAVTSAVLSTWLAGWQADGRDIALCIGGADGLSGAVLERAERRLSLSPLTLPHGLARTLLLEQLYRCHTLLSGHPYHRG